MHNNKFSSLIFSRAKKSNTKKKNCVAPHFQLIFLPRFSRGALRMYTRIRVHTQMRTRNDRAHAAWLRIKRLALTTGNQPLLITIAHDIMTCYDRFKRFVTRESFVFRLSVFICETRMQYSNWDPRGMELKSL